jgi:hypothetical protein
MDNQSKSRRNVDGWRNKIGGNGMKRLTKRNHLSGFLPVLMNDRALGPAAFYNQRDYYDYADALEHLAQYEDAEESGLLVRLPCKVGDMVYYRKGQYIYGDDVKRIVFDGMDNYVIVDANHCYTFSNFGAKVFLTREEAEATLKGETS